MKNIDIPFVEKYRPKTLKHTVLDDISRTILNNIIDTNEFPNLLCYGPPGTGKTTTIINLIESYQMKHFNRTDKSLLIHLNASDERGIDTIRTQINNFVLSKSLFNSGPKFVVLDEVDYMTKNAQHALKYLLETNYGNNVRFCLICNYISKIDNGLQHEFIKIRFNDLPKEEITNKLMYVSDKENLKLSVDTIENIQKLYKSDMRSMINFIQLCAQTNLNLENEIHIINDDICETILMDIMKENISIADNNYIYHISCKYNIEKNSVIKILFNYIIRQKQSKLTNEIIKYMENVIHTMPLIEDNNMINSIILNLKTYLH